jgi:uncharacterized protein (DUF736 family)
MATIGEFHQQDDGSYKGSIKTLTLNIKTAQLRAAESENKNAPNFRVFAGETELGAAWNKTSKAGRDYVLVKLDDPSFPAPIYANLIDADDGYSLIWSRPEPKDRQPKAEQPKAD